MCHAPRAHGDIVPFRVLCAIGLDFKAAGGSIVHYCLSSYCISSEGIGSCKHGLGTLSWLNAAKKKKTLKRASTLHLWVLFCEATVYQSQSNF